MFFGHNLSRCSTPNLLSAGVAAGTGDTQTSTVLNCGQDYGAYFIVILGTVSTNGAGLIKIQHSADNAVADPFTDVMGSGIQYTSSNSAHAFVIDVYRPQKQYLQAQVVRTGSGNTVIAGIFAILYHLSVAPEAPGTSVDNVVWLHNPGTGAA